MSDIFVLDACALIALTNQENGADVVADILRLMGNAPLIVAAIQKSAYCKSKADFLYSIIFCSPTKCSLQLSQTES